MKPAKLTLTGASALVTALISGTAAMAGPAVTNFPIRPRFPTPAPEPTSWIVIAIGVACIAAMALYAKSRKAQASQ